jgi:integrase
VTPGHVGAWIKEHHLKAKRAKPDGNGGYAVTDTDKPTTNNYRRNLIRAVKAAFKWQEEQNPKCPSPVRSVKVPKSLPRDVELTSDQFDRLAARAARSRDGGALLDLITVMRETGCRPQEVRRVEARHLDRANPCWDFPAAESKGQEHRRVVLLTDKAFAICQRLALKHPDGPIFRTSRGNQWTHRLLSYRLYKLSQRLGFPVCPYAIRHLWATEAITRGVDLLTIATIMGHRNLKMLSEVYSHINKRSDHLRAGLKQAVGG